MKLTQEIRDEYIQILREELITALGCTEPIAIAYAAAKARDVLGCMPEKLVAECSGNIIKNVKGVIVPTTKNLKGIQAAAIIGMVGGNPQKELEVLADVNELHLSLAKELLEKHICEERLLDTSAKLHIKMYVYNGEHSAMVEIMHVHTNIVYIQKDGEVLYEKPHNEEQNTQSLTDRSHLSVEGIFEFANTVDVSLVQDLLDRQIDYNCRISDEGLRGMYGANVGMTLLGAYGNDVKTRAKAAAAAGSDARMSGCEMPVVINSGSGNQGLTVSLPVIVYASELGATKEQLYRALCMSNLIAVHQKTKIGRLSAYCGAVSAAAGAGAAIAYLHGGSLEEISETITNTLGNVSGIVCDGAKPSCAAKIASSVDAAIMGFTLAMCGRCFRTGEGLVKNSVESTIDAVGEMAQKGMKSTDEEILKLMIADK